MVKYGLYGNYSSNNNTTKATRNRKRARTPNSNSNANTKRAKTNETPTMFKDPITWAWVPKKRGYHLAFPSNPSKGKWFDRKALREWVNTALREKRHPQHPYSGEALTLNQLNNIRYNKNDFFVDPLTRRRRVKARNGYLLNGVWFDKGALREKVALNRRNPLTGRHLTQQQRKNLLGNRDVVLLFRPAP